MITPTYNNEKFTRKQKKVPLRSVFRIQSTKTFFFSSQKKDYSTYNANYYMYNSSSYFIPRILVIF